MSIVAPLIASYIDFIDIPPYDNAYYYIQKEPYMNLCVSNDFSICRYSTDWLYLIDEGKNPEYNAIANNILNIIKTQSNESEYIEKNVIPLITGYKIAGHLYYGFWSILETYLSNKEKYESYNLLVYNGVMKGILDIVNFLCDANVIDKSKIIYLDDTKIYKFNKILILPNLVHACVNTPENNKIRDRICNMIQKYIFDQKDTLSLPQYAIPSNVKKLLMIKHTGSRIGSDIGCTTPDVVKSFAEKIGFTQIEPSTMNEIQLMQYFNNCEIAICSWGTTYHKNYIYLSDKCRKMIVLITGEGYYYELRHTLENNTLITQFKNAIFDYQIVLPDFSDVKLTNII